MRDCEGVAGYKLVPRSRWRNSQIVLFNNALRAETQFALDSVKLDVLGVMMPACVKPIM